MSILDVKFGQRFTKSVLIATLAIASMGMSLMVGDRVAYSHGYVTDPSSRAALCTAGENTDCGNLQYEPQSLEAPKGFPAAGPADGKIASANGAFPKMDEQSATRWKKVNLASGPVTFNWKFTANHSTTSWKYYITKQNWNPNSALTRDQFDLTPFCTVTYNGAQPPSTYANTCNVPERTGYQVILAVWEIADTANAFYNVIDVNFSGTNTTPVDTTPPTAPASLTSPAKTATSVSLAWNAATDNIGVSSYQVFQNSTLVANVSASTLAYNATNLTTNTAYSFSIKAVDAAGNVSTASNTIQVTTSALPTTDTTAPTAPSGLHIMGTPTSSSLMLMWTASTDNVAVTGYKIYNGSTLITTASATATSYTVTGLNAATTYNFQVIAVDAAGNASAASTVSGTTAQADSSLQAWAQNTSYSVNALVTYNGKTYKCLQAHTSIVSWEPAVTPALWQLQS